MKLKLAMAVLMPLVQVCAPTPTMLIYAGMHICFVCAGNHVTTMSYLQWRHDRPAVIVIPEVRYWSCPWMQYSCNALAALVAQTIACKF